MPHQAFTLTLLLAAVMLLRGAAANSEPPPACSSVHVVAPEGSNCGELAFGTDAGGPAGAGSFALKYAGPTADSDDAGATLGLDGGPGVGTILEVDNGVAASSGAPSVNVMGHLNVQLPTEANAADGVDASLDGAVVASLNSEVVQLRQQLAELRADFDELSGVAARLADVVTLATEQSVSGDKTFTGTVKVASTRDNMNVAPQDLLLKVAEAIVAAASGGTNGSGPMTAFWKAPDITCTAQCGAKACNGALAWHNGYVSDPVSRT